MDGHEGVVKIMMIVRPNRTEKNLEPGGNVRRSLLRAGALAAVSFIGARPQARADSKYSPQWAMIIALDRCMGCRTCMIACKAHNRTSAHHFKTHVSLAESSNRFFPSQCNQCQDPPCLKACPRGAVLKLRSGIITTDWAKCDGSGYCIKACPYGARFADKRYGGRSDKCDFCLERLEKGLAPVCVESCPSGARLFGDLTDPDGEFGKYLKGGNLFVRAPDLGTNPRIFYADYRPGNTKRSIP